MSTIQPKQTTHVHTPHLHDVQKSTSENPVAAKTKSVVSGILGKLAQIPTPLVSLRSVSLTPKDQTALIFDSLLLTSPLELNTAKFYILTPAGSLEMTESEIHLSIMILVGNTLYFKEGHREEIQNHFNEGKLGSIDLNKVKLVPVSENLWKTLLISIGTLTSFFDAVTETKSEEKKKVTEKHAATHKIEKSHKATAAELAASAPFKKAIEKFWKTLIKQIILDQIKDERAAKERRQKEKLEEQTQKKHELIQHEIQQYEILLKQIKEIAVKDEIKKGAIVELLNKWAASLPPFPLRHVNTLAIWRELKPKLMELFKNFYTKYQAEQMK